MRKLRTYFIINFTIFALLVLLQALMHQIGIVDDFNSGIVIQYFIISSLLSATVILINLSLSKLPVLARMLVTIAAAFLEVVLLGGGLMHWYTIRTKWILITFFLCVVITVLMYIITGVFATIHTADQINHSIQLKRKAAGDRRVDKKQQRKE